MNGQYILDGHEVVAEPDLTKWGQWMQTANRIVAVDTVGTKRVSTVFLGLDYKFRDWPHELFETMVFPECETLVRYATWDEAEAGHKQVVYDVIRREASP
jgi:hypothetical protein